MRAALLLALWPLVARAAVTTRLVNVEAGGTGVLELLHAGQWGAVCDGAVGHAEAVVACRQLGFATGDVASSYTLPYSGSVMWLTSISCTGSEAAIQSCDHDEWNSTSCAPASAARVTCTNERTVRLVDTKAFYSGRLEVLRDGVWGTVSEQFFNLNAAVVVCRQLGFPTGIPIYGAEVPQGTGIVWLTNVTCTGFEPEIESCSFVTYPVAPQDHRYDVGVACDPITVRLQHGHSRQFGVLEVYHNGQWGTVCDHGFGAREANVSCVQLGFDGGTVVYGSGLFEPEDGDIMWLDGVMCSGHEFMLESCSHSQWVVGEFCDLQRNSVVLNCTDEHDIRLGSDGVRVEVLENNTWGSVCGVGFDDRDALVVCNLLGFADGTAVYNVEPAPGPVILTDLQCSGVEPDYRDCYSAPYGTVDPACTHAQDVGVKCLNYTMVRLVDAAGNTNATSGRLEVHHDGLWGTVCRANAPVLDEVAHVVCRQLGFQHGFVMRHGHVPRGYGQIWTADPFCIGDEAEFGDCLSEDWGLPLCTHDQDIGIRCATARIGSDGYRLELFHEGAWGTVCASNDSFYDVDAAVACQEIGYARGVVAPPELVQPGAGHVIWSDDMRCTGSEDGVNECIFGSWSPTSPLCSHANDVGVICSRNSFIRLAGGSSPNLGRLEINHLGEWGTVCGSTSGIGSAADLVCKQLGYKGGGFQLAHSDDIPSGSGPIWFSDLTCDPDDYDLVYCDRSRFGHAQCDRSNELFIQCESTQIRLIGGSSPATGLLEVLHAGVWGVVCGGGFGLPEANVTCKQLGYGLGGSVFAEPLESFAVGTVWLNSVQCAGFESRLDQCNISGFQNATCQSGSFLVGVLCNSAPANRAVVPFPISASVSLGVLLGGIVAGLFGIMAWRYCLIRQGKLPPSSRLLPCGRSSAFVIPYSDIALEDEIGKGGQGVIYRGIWKNASVAVKMLQPSKSKSSGALGTALRRALMEEAAALKRLQHPNVVRVFGYCTTPNLAIVMEYVNSGSLARWIYLHHRDQSAAVHRQRWQIAQGVLAGMQVVHDYGFVHCDLKPGNVLLAIDGSNIVAKVSDLGLALKVDRRSKTAECGERGTPGYMAPELCATNRRRVSQKVDVYSFGILLVELFVGRLEWGEALPEDPRARSARLRNLAMLHALPRIPDQPQFAWLRSVLAMCTAFNPLVRPSFQELAKLLSGAVGAKTSGSESLSDGTSSHAERRVVDTVTDMFISEYEHKAAPQAPPAATPVTSPFSNIVVLPESSSEGSPGSLVPLSITGVTLSAPLASSNHNHTAVTHIRPAMSDTAYNYPPAPHSTVMPSSDTNATVESWSTPPIVKM